MASLLDAFSFPFQQTFFLVPVCLGFYNTNLHHPHRDNTCSYENMFMKILWFCVIYIFILGPYWLSEIYVPINTNTGYTIAWIWHISTASIIESNFVGIGHWNEYQRTQSQHDQQWQLLISNIASSPEDSNRKVMTSQCFVRYRSFQLILCCLRIKI